jgi:hypothetical protein
VSSSSANLFASNNSLQSFAGFLIVHLRSLMSARSASCRPLMAPGTTTSVNQHRTGNPADSTQVFDIRRLKHISAPGYLHTSDLIDTVIVPRTRDLGGFDRRCVYPIHLAVPIVSGGRGGLDGRGLDRNSTSNSYWRASA